MLLYLGTLQASIEAGDTGRIVQLESNKTAAIQFQVGGLLHITLLQETDCTNIKFIYTSNSDTFLSVFEIVVMGRQLYKGIQFKQHGVILIII